MHCIYIFFFLQFLHFYQVAFKMRHQICAQKWERIVSYYSLEVMNDNQLFENHQNNRIVLFQSMNHPPTHAKSLYVSCSIDKWEIHCIWQFLQRLISMGIHRNILHNCMNKMDCSIQGKFLSLFSVSFLSFSSLLSVSVSIVIFIVIVVVLSYWRSFRISYHLFTWQSSLSYLVQPHFYASFSVFPSPSPRTAAITKSLASIK